MSLFKNADEFVKSLHESAPYISFAARFASFRGFIFDKRINATCTSIKIAHAGFYSTGDSKKTTGKCPFCTLEQTFKQMDDPWQMHAENSPNCEYVLLGKPDEDVNALPFRTVVNLALRCATFSKYDNILEDIRILEESERENALYRDPYSRSLIEFRNATKFLTYEHRLESFESAKIDQKKVLKATSKKLAASGFYFTSKTFATCPFCLLSIDFQEIDDEWKEHQKNVECDFVKLDKKEESEWTPEEAMMLASRMWVMHKYASGLKLVAEFEKKEKEYYEFGERVNRMMAKPKCSTRRCSI
uniref:Inhibitor of Apoptosis domain protein n=2 Tax=Caenorhabditis tropicalis TaxID=1561998 RepID=A0A1I7T6V7_9PELO